VAAQWLGRGGHDDMAVVAISAPRTGGLSVVDGCRGSRRKGG
jgi:hypothetical protein